MKIDVVTPLKNLVDGPLSESIVGRARENGLLKLGFVNPRDFTSDKHKTIDDRPYGGGTGMILKAEPLYQAIHKVKKKSSFVVLTSPRGTVFNQSMAKKLAKKKHLIIVCGHYEGVDDRITSEIDMEISIGDFILTGGELAAAVMIDAVSRLLEGTFAKEGVAERESFEGNLLEAPHYTRPEVWRGMKVPEVLLSGNHKKIEAWREETALKITKDFRPDLLQTSQKGKKGKRK
ncbi:tRNA (guanine37-N1)-methyltransferase [Parelusimicrobium proximum]|uniref:tRNA (guanosine(37)-N1)-methyltransferase TrmD n=1 Tax=Parelusimicrobium proximum TaxID=3228953 RepID=UPI003D167904